MRSGRGDHGSLPARARVRVRAGLGAVLVAAACSRMRPGAVVPYQGIILDVAGQGGPQLARAAAADPTLREWLARNPRPDFVLPADAANLELVYVSDSRVVHFHRPEPGAPSQVAELSPLPSPLSEILPLSLFAGTPGPDRPVGGGCWRTAFPAARCQTCCTGSTSCATACEPAA
jgi:hypothetical protein